MSLGLILMIVLVVILLGGGYPHASGGGFGLVLVVPLVLWAVGAFRGMA